MSNSTQNDLAEEIKDMLCDAGLKPIHFKLNNSGVRILNRIMKELADARREERMKAEVETGLKNFKVTIEEISKARKEVVASLDEKVAYMREMEDGDKSSYTEGYNDACNKVLDVLATLKEEQNG